MDALLFDIGEPIRRRPTRDETEEALARAVKMAVWKRHRGRPPRGMDWDDLFQEVSARTFERLKNFRHGGRKTLFEYAYVAASYALTDIQRENMKRANAVQVENFPLLDQTA